MVAEEEIERLAAMMKIVVTDHREHVKKVRRMIEYFDILDEVGGDEEVTTTAIPLEMLRDDAHAPFRGDLARSIKLQEDGHVRVPKMM